jgi:hypothetical protein
MPNITELSSPTDLTIHPDDRAASTAREAGLTINRFGREAGAALGGAVSRAGGQIGAEIDRHNTAVAIGQLAVIHSTRYADALQLWNKTINEADPNMAPAIMQGFREKVLEQSREAYLKAAEGMPEGAQRFALSKADSFEQEMTKTMIADVARKSGEATVKNINDTFRAKSNIVGNNPEQLQVQADELESDMKLQIASHPYMTPEGVTQLHAHIETMKTRLAQSAFDAMAHRSPNAAISALDHGDFNQYSDEVTRSQWRRYAEGQAKIQKQDERQDKLQADADFKEASATKREEYINKMYDQNSGRVLPVQSRLNQRINQDVQNGVLSRADGNFLIRWNEQQYNAQVRQDKIAAAGPPLRSDPKVLDDLRKRVGDPDQPTTRQEVSDIMAAGKLTTKDAHDLAWRVGQTDAAWQAMQRPFQAQFLNFKHVMMNSLTSLVKYMEPEQQIEKFNQVEADAQRIVKAAYDSRDKQLMRDVLDPKSSKWAFKEAMSTLTTTQPAASVAAQAQAIRSAVLPETNEVRQGWQYTGPNNDAKAAAKPENWKKVEVTADTIPK